VGGKTVEYVVLIIVMSIISYSILYFVIKAAVRDAIIEARSIDSDNSIDDEEDGYTVSKIVCPNCGNKHDIDYPKCPHCKQ
jgi:hypothetical protein